MSQETVHEPLPMADDIVAAAVHGSFCPKMCNHVCPVFSVTGRDDAIPWSLHREVADLAGGRQHATDVGERLDPCNGCLACQGACTFDQDVPAQVVAARTAVMAAGVDRDPAIEAADRVAAGNSPYPGVGPVSYLGDTPGAGTAVVIGCRTPASEVAAVQTVAAALGVDVDIVAPSGCCGAVIRDLGLPESADVRGRALAATLGQAMTVVVLEEQCGAEIALHKDVVVVDVVTWLAGFGDRIAAQADAGEVTWHDPPVLARRLGVVDEARAVLTALGATVVEPEGTREHTVSAGSGLGFDLLAPEDAAALAAARRVQLDAAGAPIVTTGPEAAMLRAAGADVTSLVEFVAAHLAES